MHPADTPPHTGITAHYSRNGDLSLALARLLEDRRLLPTSETLRAFDQFHTRGHRATSELGELTELQSGQHLLDIGCGIGGPARQAAHDHGVRVVGIDLTKTYCRAARTITGWIEPALSVQFVCGDATRLPFPDAVFDVVWLQHTSMNIADKPSLYHELFRVLRPGGTLGLHEIVAGERQNVIYPTPWAEHAEQSHLISPATLKELITREGFREERWLDKTDDTLRAQHHLQTQARQGQEVGAAAILGPSFAEMARNLNENLDSARLAVIMAVFRRPA